MHMILPGSPTGASRRTLFRGYCVAPSATAACAAARPASPFARNALMEVEPPFAAVMSTTFSPLASSAPRPTCPARSYRTSFMLCSLCCFAFVPGQRQCVQSLLQRHLRLLNRLPQLRYPRRFGLFHEAFVLRQRRAPLVRRALVPARLEQIHQAVLLFQHVLDLLLRILQFAIGAVYRLLAAQTLLHAGVAQQRVLHR